MEPSPYFDPLDHVLSYDDDFNPLSLHQSRQPIPQIHRSLTRDKLTAQDLDTPDFFAGNTRSSASSSSYASQIDQEDINTALQIAEQQFPLLRQNTLSATPSSSSSSLFLPPAARAQTEALEKRKAQSKDDDGLFSCQNCDYITQDSSIMKRHERTHSKIKPFKCQDCDYRAARKDTLKQHMIKHQRANPAKKQKNEPQQSSHSLQFSSNPIYDTVDLSQLQHQVYLDPADRQEYEEMLQLPTGQEQILTAAAVLGPKKKRNKKEPIDAREAELKKAVLEAEAHELLAKFQAESQESLAKLQAQSQESLAKLQALVSSHNEYKYLMLLRSEIQLQNLTMIKSLQKDLAENIAKMPQRSITMLQKKIQSFIDNFNIVIGDVYRKNDEIIIVASIDNTNFEYYKFDMTTREIELQSTQGFLATDTLSGYDFIGFVDTHQLDGSNIIPIIMQIVQKHDAAKLSAQSGGYQFMHSIYFNHCF